MAKRITSGKRDREKLKQQKREEKIKRKDERQNSGKRSFEEMIAYVDQNGQLCSAPPEEPAKEVELEDIQIATPKREDTEDEPLTGRVEYFNAAKGYGFIQELETREKYFFHISAAPDGIAEADVVTFELERGTRGLNAVSISIKNKQ